VLPKLDWRQYGHEHLLAADCVHLLADDLDDFLMHPPTERQERPDACGDLPDVPAAHEQLVRDRVGVGGRLAQGRDEELRLPRDHEGGRLLADCATAAAKRPPSGIFRAIGVAR
jgi:hypothetical protein